MLKLFKPEIPKKIKKTVERICHIQFCIKDLINLPEMCDNKNVEHSSHKRAAMFITPTTSHELTTPIR